MAMQRSRPVVALVSVGVVVVVVAAMMLATGSGSPAVAFQQVGHWVFNRGENSVAHVDSGTRQVDARVAVPGVGDDGVFVVQGDKQGYLVGRTTVTVFGKSDLTVESSSPTGQTELPTGLEIAGGPYLVYRQAGTVVRLGVPSVSIPVGGSVGRPVGLDDGSVWLHRPDNGALCALRRDAVVLDCPFRTPAGAAGSLTALGGVPVFLDTTTDTFQLVTADAPGPVPVGVDLPAGVLVGERDSNGRLPVVAPGPNRLLLLDTSSTPQGSPAEGPPTVVPLGDGTFSSPVVSDGVVAIVETTSNQLRTFKVDGTPLATVGLPAGSGPAAVVRAPDGKIFVDDANGAQTHVVNPDGSAKSVKTGTAEVVPQAPATMESTNLSPVPELPRKPVPRAQPPKENQRPPAAEAIADVEPAGPVLSLVGRATQSGRLAIVEAQWRQPDLNGGTLVGYEVVGKFISLVSREPEFGRTTVVVPSYRYSGEIVCKGPLKVTVTTLTKAPGGTQTIRGATSTVDTNGPSDNCLVDPSVSLESVGSSDAVIAVSYDDKSISTGNCELHYSDGGPPLAAWSGRLGADGDAPSRVTIRNLEAGTAYEATIYCRLPDTTSRFEISNRIKFTTAR